MTDHRTAGVVTRVLAAGIDAVTVFVLLALAYAGVALVLFAVKVQAFTFPATHMFFTMSSYVFGSMLYLAVCWSMTGRSVGKVIMGLRVVTTGDRRLPPLRALLRAVGCVVFPVGLAWVAISPNRMSVQDMLIRSKVVYSADRLAPVGRDSDDA